MAQGMVLDNMSMGRIMTMTGREDFFFDWDYSYGDHDMYEVDAGWGHYFNSHLSSFVGYRWTNEMEAEDRVFAGFTYVLPLFVDSFTSVDSEGDFRFGIGKEFQLTDRWSLSADVEYDTNTEWEWEVSSELRLTKEFSLAAMYHSEHDWGLGIKFRF